MKKVVVDTNILIDYAHGYANWLNDLLGSGERIAEFILPTIVIAEYFTSTALEDKHEIAVADETFALFTKQDLNEEIAKILGGILRHKSFPPGANLADLIIASTAIYLDAQLATRNRLDFSGIPDLRFFEPKNSSY